MRLSGIACGGIAMAAALAGAPAFAGDIGPGSRHSAAIGQLAQGGPRLLLVCRGGGDASFDFYANKNNYRELCVFFRWITVPLRRTLPPPGHCGFVNRAPERKERAIRLFCRSITRTVQIRRWPPGSRQRYQFIGADAPYLAHITNPRYIYRLLVISQETSFKVEGFPGRPKKKRKMRRRKRGRKTK